MGVQDTWLPQDAVNTREFLNSPSGQKFLSILQQTVPLADGKSEIEEAMNFRAYKGATKIIQRAIELAQDPQGSTDPSTQYFNTADA